MMRRSINAPRHRRARQTPFGSPLLRSARGGLALFILGTIVAVAGTPTHLQDALRAQRQLVEESPSDLDRLNDLGNLLVLSGDLAAAEEIYRRALAHRPNDVTVLYNLALILLEQDHPKEGHKILRSILEIEPRHAWTHYQLGTFYAQQKNREKALLHYTEAFTLDRSLALPEVNPHIVENRLATETLLQMYVNAPASTQAPRIYKQPGDVATLLLLPRPEEQPTTAPAPEAAPEATTESIPRRHRAVYADPAARNEQSEAASPPGSVEPRPGTTGERSEVVTPVEPIGSSEDRSRTAPRMIDASSLPTRPSEQGPAEPTAGREQVESRSGAEAPGSPVPPADPSAFGDSTGDTPGGFIPGVQSTGRLDIELLPRSEPAPVTSRS